MATTSKRDVTLGLGIETTGEDAVQRLAAEVRKLAQEGDPAAAEFRALADQLDRLGDQVASVQAVRALNDDLDRLTAAQREAAAASKAAKDALEAQTASAAQLREQQRAAAQAVVDGNVQLKEARGAVRTLAAEYDAAGKKTQEYRDRLAAATSAVTAADVDLVRLKSSLTAANVAAAQAVNEEARLAAAYLRTRDAAGGADAAVRERAAALRAAEAAASNLALGTTDLAQADALLLDQQARLVAQLNTLKAQQAERIALDQQAAAAADRVADRVRATAAAYEQEQAALAEQAAVAARAAAERQRVADATERAAAAEREAAAAAAVLSAKRREQQEHDEAAAIAAYRLAEARKAAQAAAQSELLLLKDSEDFTRRYEQAQRDAAAAVEREGVEAMRLLEQAARAADKAQEQLTASLRETEAAAEKYAAAIGEAAAAGERDVGAAQQRRAAAEALIASERALTAEQREAALARNNSRAALIAEAQALLAAARAADESRAATGRLVQQVTALGTSLDKAFGGAGRGVLQAGTASFEAFGQVGIRSLQAIEAEVARTDAAMSRLARDLQAGRISADDFARAAGAATVKLNQLNAEARQVQTLPGQFERLSASIQSVISRFGAIGAAVATVGVAARPVIEATVALEQMRRVLTTVTGSAEVAEQQIDFLRKTSQQAGQSFTEVGQSYAKFAASALQSGLSIQQVQSVFKSVALAAGNLGLSSDQAKRALEALSQIASKGCHAPGSLIRMADGNVRAVETIAVGELLRGPDGAPRVVLQLARGRQSMYRVLPAAGEPFVVNIEHKLRVNVRGAATTLTVAEYLDLDALERGGLTLRHADFGPVAFEVVYEGEGPFCGFAISGDHLYLDAQGFEHHNTVSMEELRQQLGDALPGVLPLLAKELGLTQNELNKVVESGNLLALEAIPAIGRALTSLQPQDGVVNGMVATWNRFINVVKEAGTTLVEGPLGATAGAVLRAFGGVLRDVSVVAVGASEAFKLFGLSVLAVFDALTPGGAKLKDLGKTLDDFAQQAGANIAKFKETAYGASDGTDRLASSTTAAGESFAKLALEQQKLIDAAVLGAQAAEKGVQARQKEGEASALLAGLIGDETQAREANVVAAQRMAEAAEAQARADANVVAALEAAKAATIERAEAESLGAEATKAAVEALEKKIIKAQADAEKSHAQAAASRAAAEAADLAAQAARNNADRIGDLRKAHEDAVVALENARLAYVAGAATEKDVKAATDALAKAKGLLRDAINDVSEALERQIKAMQADAKLTEAGLKLELEQQKNAEAKARSMGNEYQVRQAILRQREIEILLSNLSVDTKRREAEATLRAIDTQEAELRALGQLTPEKALELEARRKVQLAAVLEAQAANEAGAAKRKEFEALKAGTPLRDAHTGATARGTTATTDNTTATDDNSVALDRNARSAGSAATAVDRLTTARKKYEDLLLATRGVQGNKGLAGIKDPNLTGVRDPGGSANSIPTQPTIPSGFGALDGQALAGQYKPPDNSGNWVFDVAAWQAAGGATGGFADDNSVRRFWKRKPGTFAPGTGAFGGENTTEFRARGSSKTVNVNLNIGGKTVSLSGTETTADILVRALEDAQRNSGS